MELSSMWKCLKGHDIIGKKGDQAKDGRGRNHDGKGKTAEGEAKSKPFDGYCIGCKKYGHRQRGFWDKEPDTAPGSTAAAEEAVEAAPATVGLLLRGDQEESGSDKSSLADYGDVSDKSTLADYVYGSDKSSLADYGYGSNKSTLTEATSASDYGYGSDKSTLTEATSASDYGYGVDKSTFADCEHDLVASCQVCSTRRAVKTCWGCGRLTCTPCGLNEWRCLACDWITDEYDEKCALDAEADGEYHSVALGGYGDIDDDPSPADCKQYSDASFGKGRAVAQRPTSKTTLAMLTAITLSSVAASDEQSRTGVDNGLVTLYDGGHHDKLCDAGLHARVGMAPALRPQAEGDEEGPGQQLPEIQEHVAASTCGHGGGIFRVSTAPADGEEPDHEKKPVQKVGPRSTTAGSCRTLRA
jgi:hypothetical protein